MDWYDYARIFATPVAAGVLALATYLYGLGRGRAAERDDTVAYLMELYTWPERPDAQRYQRMGAERRKELIFMSAHDHDHPEPAKSWPPRAPQPPEREAPHDGGMEALYQQARVPFLILAMSGDKRVGRIVVDESGNADEMIARIAALARGQRCTLPAGHDGPCRPRG